MLRKNNTIYLLLSLLLVAIFIYPSVCINAAKNGLLLWFNTIIPTLFPFIILSYIITNTPMINGINRVLSPMLNKTLKLSAPCTYTIFMGLLAGYPMGAVITNDLYHSKMIRLSEAKFLLAISNNASPIFIIGFIATSLLSEPSLGLPLLLCIYSANFIMAVFSYIRYQPKAITSFKSVKKNTQHLSFPFFDTCIVHTSKILLKIGGYIVFFSIPIALLLQLPIQHPFIQFLVSTIELSVGENIVANLHCAIPLKFAMLCGLTSFGSLSVLGQTASVLTHPDLSKKSYLISKIANGSISFLIGYLWAFYLL